MTPDIHTLPASLRPGSPLCTAPYRETSEQLPKAIPPKWMTSSMVWSMVATIALCLVTLMSPMDEFVTAPGEVRPSEFAYAFSKTTGILESVDAFDGQEVKRGQVLAKLDGFEIRKEIGDIDGQISQTQAELAMAEATSRKVAAAPVPSEFLFSEVEMERQKEIQSLQQDYLHRLDELQKTGAASSVEMMNVRLQLIAADSLVKRNQQAYELFKGDFGMAVQSEALQRENMIRARLAALKSKRELAELEFKRLDIVSPESGNLLATARRFPGEKIEAGSALFKVTDASKPELRLYATEDRVNLIQPGQLVRFRANNNPDRLAPLAIGRVTEVARDRDMESGDISLDQSKATYRVKVAIEKEPYPLAVGATVEAEIVLERRPFWRLLFMKPKGT
jgi:HlyD family secretion protein